MFGMGGGNQIEVEVQATGADQFARDMDDASGAVEGFADKTKIAGAALAGIGVAGLGAIKKFTGQAMELETAMAEVTTLMGEGENAADTFSGTIADLTREFAPHGGQVETTAGLYQTLSAGFTDAADAEKVLTASMSLATAGLADNEEATRAMTGTLNAYGMTADEAESVSDTFFTTVRLGQTTVGELAAQVGQVTPIAAQAGVTFDEVGATLATLTAAGQSTSQATTGLRQTLVGMLKPTDALATVFNQLGYESGEAMIEALGFEGALAAVKAESERTGVPMTDLFGSVEALNAVLPLTGDMAGKFSENLDEMGNKAGATEAALAKIQETTEFQLRQAMADVTVATTQFGFALLDVLMPAVTSVTGAIAAASDWFLGLDETTRKVIATAFILTTVLSLIAGTFLLVGPAAAAAATAISGLLLPIGAVIAAVSALSAVWIADFLGIRTAVMGLVDVVRTGIGGVIASALALGQEIMRSFEAVWGEGTRNNIASTEALVGRVQELFGTVLAGAFEWISAILQKATTWWQAHGTDVLLAVDALIGAVLGAFAAFQETFSAVVNAVLGPILALWDEHRVEVLAYVEDLKQQTLAKFTEITLFITNNIGPVLEWLKDAWRLVRDAILEALAPILPKLQELGEKFGFVDEKGRPTIETLMNIGLRLAGLLNPITLVIGLVGTLGQAWAENMFGIQTTTDTATSRILEFWNTRIVPLVQTTAETFWAIHETIMTVLNTIYYAVFEPFVNEIMVLWRAHGSALVSEMAMNLQVLHERVSFFLGLVLEVFRWLAGAIMMVVGPMIAAFMEAWRMWGDEIITVVRFFSEIVAGTLGTLFDGLITAVRMFGALWRGDWELLWTLARDFLVRTFEGIVQFATQWGGRFLGWLGGLVEGVIGWFQNLYQRLIGGSIIPEMFEAILLYAQGWGPRFLGWLSGLVEMFTQSVLGWMQRVYTAIGTTFESIYLFFTGFGTRVLEWLTGLTTTFVERVRLWFQHVTTTVFTSLQQVYTQFLLFGQNALTWLQTTATQFVQRTMLWMQQFGGNIVAGLQFVTQRLIEFSMRTLTQIQQLATLFMQTVTGWMQSFWTTVTGAISQIYQTFVAWSGQVLGWLGQTATNFIATVSGWMNAFWQTWTNALSSILSAAAQFGGQLLGWLGQTANNFVSTVSSWMQATWQTFQNGFISVLNTASSFGSDLLRWLVTTANNFLSAVSSWLQTTYNAFTSGFSSIASYLGGWGGRFISWAWTTMSGVWDNWREGLRLIVEGLWESFEAMLTYVMEWAVDFATEIFNAVENVKGYFEDLYTEGKKSVENLLSETLSKATTWKKKFVGKFQEAYEEVKGKFEKLKKEVVGNSIVPDMLNMTLSEASGWRGKYVGEFESANSAVASSFADTERRATGTGIARGGSGGASTVFNPFGGSRATLDTVAGGTFAVHSELQRQTDIMTGAGGGLTIADMEAIRNKGEVTAADARKMKQFAMNNPMASAEVRKAAAALNPNDPADPNFRKVAEFTDQLAVSQGYANDKNRIGAGSNVLAGAGGFTGGSMDFSGGFDAGSFNGGFGTGSGRDPRSEILSAMSGHKATGAWTTSQQGPGVVGGRGVIGRVDPEYAMREGFHGEWGSVQNAAAIQEMRDWDAVASNPVFAREAGIQPGDTAALTRFAKNNPEAFSDAFYRATSAKGGISDLVYDALPAFASGGLVTSELIGRIAERGPEAVIPLDRLERMVGRSTAAVAERLSGSGGGGPSVNIENVEVHASSRREGRRAASAFSKELKSRLHRTKPNGTR